MLKQLLGWRSPAGAQARLSVLIFHRVLARHDPLFPFEMTAARFDALCGWLKQWFNLLPLDLAVQRLQAGTLPARAACITFDDGYADNHQVALPILQRYDLPATFFIATGFLDGGRMWNDTVIEAIRTTPLTQLPLDGLLGPAFAALPVASLAQKHASIQSLITQIKYQPLVLRAALAEKIAQQAQVQLSAALMMSSAQVLGLRRAGMQIGAHTVTHPILAGLDRTAARHELSESKYALEHLLGERVGLFAYPNGKPVQDYNAESVALVRDVGFDAAVSTHHAAAGGGTDVFQIPRYTPWERSRLRLGARLLGNLKNSGLTANS